VRVHSNESESEDENGMKFHPLQYSTAAFVSPFATPFISVFARTLSWGGGMKDEKCVHYWMSDAEDEKFNNE
jgi:hypothetical protein